MEPILSREAQVVGWLKHDVVYDESGRPRGFVRGRAVFDMNAQQVGTFAYGFFRDASGDAVAFTNGASGGPITPTLRVVPEPPKTWDVRTLPDPRVSGQAPTPSLRWSELDWNAFLGLQPDSAA